MITYDQNVDDYNDDDEYHNVNYDDNDDEYRDIIIMMIMSDDCQLCDMTLSTIMLMTIERSSVRLEVTQVMHSL